MSDRLTTDYVGGEAKQRRFHDTLVDGALELCDLTKSLNVTNSAKVLISLKSNVKPQQLSENPPKQRVLKVTKKDAESLFHLLMQGRNYMNGASL
jgi:hypothetical protein